MDKKTHFYVSGSLFVTLLVILSVTGCSRNKQIEADMNQNKIIIDRLDRAESYFDMHPAFEKAFAFLRRDTLPDMPTGRHQIDGERMFCIISKGPGRKRQQAKLEAHRKYIDIQYIISGTDEMGYRPTASCMIPDTDYDAENDIEFFGDEAQSWTKVPAGSFTIFFPRDAHAPMVGDGQIHKVVVKIAVE